VKIALDTNVLAYAEGANGAVMRDSALDIIQRLPQESVVLPVQTLGELFNVLVRKVRRRPVRARTAVMSWRDAYPLVETSGSVIVGAMDLAAEHGLSILGLGDSGGVGGGRLWAAFVGRSSGWVYLAWSHRHEPVFRQRPSASEGRARAARKMTALIRRLRTHRARCISGYAWQRRNSIRPEFSSAIRGSQECSRRTFAPGTSRSSTNDAVGQPANLNFSA